MRRPPDVGSSDQRTYIDGIMTPDLADDEARALAEHLGQAIGHHPYPLAPQLDKSILAKLEPPKPQPEPLPPLRPAGGRVLGAGGEDDEAKVVSRP